MKEHTIEALLGKLGNEQPTNKQQPSPEGTKTDAELRERAFEIGLDLNEPRDLEFEKYIEELLERAIPTIPTETSDTQKEFPIHTLPPAAQEITREIARTRLLPCDLPGSMALATVAAAIGKGLELDCPPHRTRANIYLLATARSGTGKSDCFRDISAPLYLAEAELNRAREQTRHQKRAEVKLLEKQISKVTGEATLENVQKLAELEARLESAEREARSRRIIIEDATEAAMKQALADNREQIALMSAEGGQVVSNLLGRYGDTKGQTADTVILKSFSGDPDAQSRVGSGETRLESPCMTIGIVLTPDKCKELLKNLRFVDGGLMPRFLIATSNARPKRDDGTERRPDAGTLDRWQETILELVSTYRNADAPAVIRCEPEALEVFRNHWNTEFVDNFDELETDAAFFSRHLEQIKRLSLNLHALKHGRDACKHYLTADTARDAIELVDWFTGNQEEAIGQSRADRTRDLAERIKDIALEKGTATDKGQAVTLRKLKRSGITEKEARNVAELQPEKFKIELHTTRGRSSLRLVMLN